MKISPTNLSIRIDIDFEDCEVDMVFREAAASGVQTSVPSILCDGAQIKVDEDKLSRTPIGGTVDFALSYLAGYVDESEMRVTSGRGMSGPGRYDSTTDLEDIGFKVESWYGLMMGGCHLVLTIPINDFSPRKLKQAMKIVSKTFNRFVKYYD